MKATFIGKKVRDQLMGMSTYAWLLEAVGKDGNLQASYFGLDKRTSVPTLGITTNAYDAVQFKRKQDAEIMLKAIKAGASPLLKDYKFKAVEHGFM